MATFKINLKGVAKVAAKGKTYYYAWRGGPRIMADIGTPEFIEEFNALRNSQKQSGPTASSARGLGSIVPIRKRTGAEVRSHIARSPSQRRRIGTR